MGEGFSLLASSFARMNASIGLTAHAAFFTFGAATRLTRLKGPPLPAVLQRHPFIALKRPRLARRRRRAASACRRAIHFSKSAITASGSFPEGGICRRGIGVREHLDQTVADLRDAILAVQHQAAHRRLQRRRVAGIAFGGQYRSNFGLKECDVRRLRPQAGAHHRKQQETKPSDSQTALLIFETIVSRAHADIDCRLR